MNSSEAPTPVMPNTATALASPPRGNWKRSPSSIFPHEKSPGWRVSKTAHSTVSMLNKATLTVASPSIRS